MADVKSGKETTEFEETKKADVMSIIGLILGAVIAYAPKVIESLNGESKWAIISGAVLGCLALAHSALTKLGYIRSRTEVKVAAEKRTAIEASAAAPAAAPEAGDVK